MQLIDWRGNPYTVGSKVIYAAMSGRSVELQEAEVLEIKTVYRNNYTGKWVTYKEGDPIPREMEYDYDNKSWAPTGDEITKFETRVKLQPTRKGSRNFSMREDTETWYENKHTGERKDWKWIDETYYLPAAIKAHQETGSRYHNRYREIAAEIDKDGWERKEKYVLPKPVNLTVIDNITVIE